jgi:hypothetical protein
MFRSFTAQAIIDRLSGRRLLSFIVALTFIPALGYFIASALYPEHGLVASSTGPVVKPGHVSFLTALYFSVTTETTLGFGDVTPVGLSRALACVQVLTGLALAGFCIAKLTSMNGRNIREAGSKASGVWLVMNRLPSGQKLVSVTEIRLIAGSIHYGGSNYTLDAEFCGTWDSTLLECNDNVLRFRYSNRNSITEYFDEGVSHLTFRYSAGCDSSKLSFNKAVWDTYGATAQDFGKQIQVTFEGWRVKPEQVRKLNGTVQEKREVICEFARSFERFGLGPSRDRSATTTESESDHV